MVLSWVGLPASLLEEGETRSLAGQAILYVSKSSLTKGTTDLSEGIDCAAQSINDMRRRTLSRWGSSRSLAIQLGGAEASPRLCIANGRVK